jgi:hypothetical protein
MLIDDYFGRRSFESLGELQAGQIRRAQRHPLSIEAKIKLRQPQFCSTPSSSPYSNATWHRSQWNEREGKNCAKRGGFSTRFIVSLHLGHRGGELSLLSDIPIT